jgi:hypothetical protein
VKLKGQEEKDDYNSGPTVPIVPPECSDTAMCQVVLRGITDIVVYRSFNILNGNGKKKGLNEFSA